MIQTGQVKFFNERKGWGFIELDTTKEEVFCHYSSIQTDGFKTLTQGDTVEFEVEDGDRGLKAINVVKVVKGNS